MIILLVIVIILLSISIYNIWQIYKELHTKFEESIARLEKSTDKSEKVLSHLDFDNTAIKANQSQILDILYTGRSLGGLLGFKLMDDDGILHPFMESPVHLYSLRQINIMLKTNKGTAWNIIPIYENELKDAVLTFEGTPLEI